jgi:A/G-specific adenine glycosylase
VCTDSNSKTQNAKLQKLTSLLLDWYAANARDLPWRRTRDPYAIWVSEIMLQQTQVRTVVPYWNCWMKELPTIEAAANAGSDELHKLWEGLGYYTRVRNLQKAAQVIVEKHNGKFPDIFDDVLALPGIGRYTAGAICSIAFNQPTPILDGNVIRVLTRIFGIAENPKEKDTNARLWRLAEELVTRTKGGRQSALQAPDAAARPPYPKNSSSHLNQSLMELGALICTPRNPQCGVCPAGKLCVALKKDRVEELPNIGKREAVTVRRFIAFVMQRSGKYLVRQRPGGTLNAHLWEFPNFEIRGREFHPDGVFRSEFGFAASAIHPLTTVKHSITRYRITLEAFHVKIGMEKFFNGCSEFGVWKTPSQLKSLAFASAHKKVLSTLSAA